MDIDLAAVASAANRIRTNLDNSGLDPAGNCFLAALALRDLLGADVQRVQGLCRGDSHEWAAIEGAGGVVHIDLTGDQFGLPAVQILSDLPEEYSGWSGQDWDDNLAREFAADLAALTA